MQIAREMGAFNMHADGKPEEAPPAQDTTAVDTSQDQGNDISTLYPDVVPTANDGKSGLILLSPLPCNVSPSPLQR